MRCGECLAMPTSSGRRRVRRLRTTASGPAKPGLPGRSLAVGELAALKLVSLSRPDSQHPDTPASDVLEPVPQAVERATGEIAGDRAGHHQPDVGLFDIGDCVLGERDLGAPAADGVNAGVLGSFILDY
jgi:hypothetical protein